MHSCFFPGWTIIDFDPTLVEPKLDLFVTGLVRRWLLKEVNFYFFATVEITDYNIAELGECAWADVPAKSAFVLVH